LLTKVILLSTETFVILVIIVATATLVTLVTTAVVGTQVIGNHGTLG